MLGAPPCMHACRAVWVSSSQRKRKVKEATPKCTVKYEAKEIQSRAVWVVSNFTPNFTLLGCMNCSLDEAAVCSGNGNGAADSKEFDTLMAYVRMPTGCRHAFLSQNFSNDPKNVPGVHTLCHGGCDVCDLRVAAVRDLSNLFCRSILLHSRGGLPEPDLLKRCMGTPRNQVGSSARSSPACAISTSLHAPA